MNIIQKILVVLCLSATSHIFASYIPHADRKVQDYIFKIYFDETMLTDKQIEDAYWNLNYLKGPLPSQYERLKKELDEALQSRRARQQERPAEPEPQKNVSNQVQEFENFEDISNSIGAGLAEVESLLEQLQGMENMQARQQVITIMDAKLQALGPLFEAQKKFAHRNKTVINRLKKRYTAAQANVAVLRQELQVDLKHAQE